MESQTARDPLRHSRNGTAHSFGNGVKGNGRYYVAPSAGRAIKREIVDEMLNKDGFCIANSESPRENASNNGGLLGMSTSSSSQQLQGNHKLRLQRRFSTELDVCAWLRDEPMDISTSGFLQSGSDSAVVKTFSAGSGGSDCNIGGGHYVTDGSGSSGYMGPGDVSDEGAAQHKGGFFPTEKLYAQLRQTKIKESILLEGIQRLGGGQKGLRGVIKAILFWLEAKNRFNSQSSDSLISKLELPSSRLDEIEQFPWSNLDCGSVVDSQAGQEHFAGQNLNLVDLNQSLPTPELASLVKSASSSRDDFGSPSDLRPADSGSGEYGQVQLNYESHQSFVSSVHGEPLRLQGAGPTLASAHKDPSSGDWVPSMREYVLRPEKSHRSRMIRKLSPSPDDSGLASYDDALSQQQQSKIRRHSPTSAGYSSSSQSSSSEFPTYVPSPLVSEVLGPQCIFGAMGASPFAPGGPFNMSPSNSPPSEPHSLDFNAFGTQGSILVDENLGLGSSVHGCGLIDRLGSLGYPLTPEHPVDRKPTGGRLGVVSKSKGSPTACTRLARKQRMDRNRKAALHQVHRGAFETSSLLVGKPGGLCSPGSVRGAGRSQGSPAVDGPTCRTIDRRDQENLQFLLLKVLRPSDVGNLGRIVLPKIADQIWTASVLQKDAESHLPWLGAREGIQFACEDYDTGEMMTLRYRFWPNNKSRMYLLENTGDFVKKHRLQESDRMLIYRNKKQGTYIIRARKAHECLDGLANIGHSEDLNEDTKEINEQNSPGEPCSSGTSSLSGTGTESSLSSGHEGASEPCVPVPAIVTSQDDLLNFADLPDAPMGEGTDNLVRFPSLESFDVELLELGPREEVTSCVLTACVKEE